MSTRQDSDDGIVLAGRETRPSPELQAGAYIQRPTISPGEFDGYTAELSTSGNAAT